VAIKPLDKALVIQDSENFIEKLRNVASLVPELGIDLVSMRGYNPPLLSEVFTNYFSL